MNSQHVKDSRSGAASMKGLVKTLNVSRKGIAASAVILLAMWAWPTVAHHSTAVFDNARVVRIDKVLVIECV